MRLATDEVLGGRRRTDDEAAEGDDDVDEDDDEEDDDDEGLEEDERGHESDEYIDESDFGYRKVLAPFEPGFFFFASLSFPCLA